MGEFSGFWDRLDGARAGTRFEDLEKLFAAIGSIGGGKKMSRSTWYSYQRWFTGKGQGTSPTVQFLSRVAMLLRMSLVLDLRPGVSVEPPGGTERTEVTRHIEELIRVMSKLDPDTQAAMAEAAFAKLREMAKPLPPDGDDSGRRPPPSRS